MAGVHELLLELAGRLDDDLVAWTRELVAVGEEGQAVELAVAALVAERVALPAAVRAAVVAASRAAHTDLDADAELAPPAPDEPTRHRFDPGAGSSDGVAAVLAALPARRLAGCTLHLTWRRTPAGAAPGPVPRAVVLVETGADRSADVLAYLLATELDRAGVPASVEVFTAGAALPAYHVAALRAAGRIEVGASVIAPAGVVVARTAAEAAARGAGSADPGAVRTGPVRTGPVRTGAGQAGPLKTGPLPGDPGQLDPGQVDPGQLDPGQVDSKRVDPGRVDPSQTGTGQADTVRTDLGRTDLGRTDLGRTDTATLFVVPSGDDAAGPAAEARRAGRRRRREPAEVVPPSPGAGTGTGTGTGEEPPDTDPFHGPLRVPLLAPLLDPTAQGPDDPGRSAVPTPIRPVPAQPAADGPDEPAEPQPATPVGDAARDVAPVAAELPAELPAGAPGEVPADVPQEWEDDWRSGDWAMPPADRPQPAAEHFDAFEPPAAQAQANAAEQTGRTEQLARPAPAGPELPAPHLAARDARDRSEPPVPGGADPAAFPADPPAFPADPAPFPAADHPELPSRTAPERRRPAGPRPPATPFGAPAAEAGVEGTAAFPPPAGREAAQQPADVSLFDSPTARVGSTPRSAPPGPDPAGPGEVSLFGEPPRDAHRPDGPPPPPPTGPSATGPSAGRRRRPEVEEPAPDAESSVLDSTERDLLAQLQAELADRERRPRPYRRARGTAAPAVNGHGVNGHGVNGHGVNGHGPGDLRPDGPAAG